MIRCGWGGFAAQKNRLVFSSATGAWQTQPALLGMLRRSLDIPVTQKTNVASNPRGPFSASHEARRRMAVFLIQLARSHTIPASREACCRAAVKPRSSRMSPYAPVRPTGAQFGVKGGERKTQGGLSMGQPGLPLAD